MVPRRMRDAIPAEPPERVRTLDPRIAAEFARNRRIHSIGFAVIVAMYLGLALVGIALNVGWPGAASTAAPVWFNAALGVCVAVTVAVALVTVRSWRCPNCHRYLYNELYWPGTRIQLCRRCGIRLA